MPTIASSNKIERKGLILALVCVAQFMVILDVSIVNVALPSIRTDLHLSQQGLQWVINAYTIVFGGLLLLGGRAADIFGQRKIFLLGLALFGGASLVGGLATNEGILIAARAAQGLGGAVLSPATLTILATTFSEGRERSRAMGMWSTVAGAGGAAGALLGGILTDLVNWRWIFFINVPIAIGAIVVARRQLHSRNQRHAKSLDTVGAVLVTGGLVTLVYSIVQTSEYGWTSARTLGVAAVAIVLLAWFIFHEAKVAKEPLMPLSLWKYRSLSVANITMFFLGTGMFAMWFSLSLIMQNALGYSPLSAGLAFVPQTVAIMAGAQVAARLMHRTTPRVLVGIGTALGAIGLVLLSRLTDHSTFWADIFLPGVITTFGMGLTMMPIVTAAMAGIRREEAGLASGLINTSRQIGGSIGLAALSTLAVHYTSHHLDMGPTAAYVAGYDKALLVGGILVFFGGVVMVAFSPKAVRAHAAAPVVETEATAEI